MPRDVVAPFTTPLKASKFRSSWAIWRSNRPRPLETAKGCPTRLALYQPDIPQNTGTMLRLAACLGAGVDIIGPAAFDLTDRALRRAGLDYIQHVEIDRFVGWTGFSEARLGAGPRGRVVLLTTKSEESYTDFRFAPDDCLLLGRESAGVPEHVHHAVDARVTIPMQPALRSLNVAVAAAMVLGEALRQTGGFVR